MVLRWKHFLTSTPGFSSSAATWAFFSSTFSWRPTRHNNRRSSINSGLNLLSVHSYWSANKCPKYFQARCHRSWYMGIRFKFSGRILQEAKLRPSFIWIYLGQNALTYAHALQSGEHHFKRKNQGLPKPQALSIHPCFNCEKSANTVPSAAASSTTVRAAWSSWNATSFWTTGALELRSGSKYK